MKKLITLFAVLFITAISYGQILSSFAVKTAEWNQYSNSWDVVSYRNCDVSFTLVNGTMYANDDAHSTYKPFKINVKQEDYVSFDAYDEKGRKCGVVFDYRNASNVLCIIYGRTIFMYYLN